jgi:hypothetical protein
MGRLLRLARLLLLRLGTPLLGHSASFLLCLELGGLLLSLGLLLAVGFFGSLPLGGLAMSLLFPLALATLLHLGEELSQPTLRTDFTILDPIDSDR